MVVPHFNGYGFPAVQTGGIHPHRLAREKPADRQRLEPSLGKPLLLSVHRYAVLGGQVVEGREGDYVIRPRMESARYPGVHQVADQLASIFHRQPQLGCHLGVVRRLPRVNNALHYAVKARSSIAWSAMVSPLLYHSWAKS